MIFSKLYNNENNAIYLANPNSFNHKLAEAIAETHIFRNQHIDLDYDTQIDIYKHTDKIHWYATLTKFTFKETENPTVNIEVPKFPDMYKNFSYCLSNGYVNQIMYIIDTQAKEIKFFIEFEETD